MYDGDRVAILIDGDDSPTVVDGVFAPRERIKIVSDVVPSTSQVGKNIWPRIRILALTECIQANFLLFRLTSAIKWGYGLTKSVLFLLKHWSMKSNANG